MTNAPEEEFAAPIEAVEPTEVLLTEIRDALQRMEKRLDG